jgi:lipoprotein-releasing system ATP-binding protein
MNNSILLQASNVHKSYQSASKRIDVLVNLEFTIHFGKMIAIMGASGVGKSTLLHLLGGLDRPDSGEILFEGENILKYSPDQMAHFRNQKVGFVFQMHHLLPEFDTLENTMMPHLLKQYDRTKAAYRATNILSEVGLTERLDHRPGQLSGGEQQRVAVARALMQDPVLILADEPTGNLDENTAASIFQLFRDLHEKRNLSFVIATHNPDLATVCDEVYILHEGKLHPKAL